MDFDIIVTYEADLVVTVDKICCASLTESPSGMKEGDAQAEIALPFVALVWNMTPLHWHNRNYGIRFPGPGFKNPLNII